MEDGRLGIKQYIVCPSADLLTEVVERLLWIQGWEKADNEVDASLVVLNSDMEKCNLNSNLLSFYHNGLGGLQKAVLCISNSAESANIQDFPFWLRIQESTIKSFLVISNWLESFSDFSCKHLDLHSEPRMLHPVKCNELLAGSMGISLAILKRDRGNFRPGLNKALGKLEQSQSMAEFYSYLCQLSKDNAEYEHDVVKKIDNPWKASRAEADDTKNSGLVQAIYERPFRTACEGLRNSLCKMPLSAGIEEGLSLLLVDDAFHEFKPVLLEIIRELMPRESNLYVWNPSAEKDLKKGSPRSIFNEICSYQSCKPQSLFRKEINVQCYRLYDNKTYYSLDGYKQINELLSECQFVLVDQLFRFESGSEMKGADLIRGLSRITRDMLSVNDIQQKNIPKIVALSRTEAPAQIQKALRLGGKAYVLKSNLLALPSVLRQTQNSVPIKKKGQNAAYKSNINRIGTGLHQNLRALYRLPNETRGLLESIRIPRLSFHRKRLQESDQRIYKFERLIRSLPKPDLHVHVGSSMSVEFLIAGSLIGLLKYTYEDIEPLLLTGRDFFWGQIFKNHSDNEVTIHLCKVLFCEPTMNFPSSKITAHVENATEWIESLGETSKSYLAEQCLLSPKKRDADRYSSFRSVLHKELGVKARLKRDKATEKIAECPNLLVAFFIMTYSEEFYEESRKTLNCDNLIRAYLLMLAAGKSRKSKIALNTDNFDLLALFNPDFDNTQERDAQKHWNNLHEFFYSKYIGAPDNSKEINPWHPSGFRQRGWRLPENTIHLPFRLVRENAGDSVKPSENTDSFWDDPIVWSVATGLRSNNLLEYLEGCEFSGAEHLQHPFSMHLYAQQCLVNFIGEGVFYAELRGSPDGYVNTDLGFEFNDACQCFTEAFTQAQEIVMRAYQGQNRGGGWLAGLLDSGSYSFESVRNLFSHGCNRTEREGNPDDVMCVRLPCKVSLIYTGKRHKSTRQMILEAAAAAVARPTGERTIGSASEFVNSELCRCHVVGFDLAGEESDHPPSLFTDEFRRLSRLHIPLTVHAGENGSAQFIEDSILELRARRIGHGLSLVEDAGLVARVREDRICVELCPVSNHQTTYFGNPDDASARQYPLRSLLDGGVLVCINTDNPMVSHTNMVKEFFQASYAYGGDGLSLWNALRLIRFGYIASFLSLPERKAMLELVSQHVFDLFSDANVIQMLRDLQSRGGE